MSVHKEKEFETTRLEVCRNCHGTGKVYGFLELTTCPVCDGRRVVKKTVKGVLTVESLKDV